MTYNIYCSSISCVSKTFCYWFCPYPPKIFNDTNLIAMKKRSTKTVKKVLKFLLPAICLFLQCRIVNGQNAFRSGDGWGSGWTTNNYYSLGLFGTSAGWSFTNSNGGTP